jgi:hypothetical protein
VNEKITGGIGLGALIIIPATVPISLDGEIAKDLDAKIGDELIFDVQVQSKRRSPACALSIGNDFKRTFLCFSLRSGDRAHLPRPRKSRRDG